VWYGRELSEISRRQWRALVAMVIAPSALDPVRHAEASAERVRRVERLVAGEYAPRGLMDVYYGSPPAREGLPAMSCLGPCRDAAR